MFLRLGAQLLSDADVIDIASGVLLPLWKQFWIGTDGLQAHPAERKPLLVGIDGFLILAPLRLDSPIVG